MSEYRLRGTKVKNKWAVSHVSPRGIFLYTCRVIREPLMMIMVDKSPFLHALSSKCAIFRLSPNASAQFPPKTQKKCTSYPLLRYRPRDVFLLSGLARQILQASSFPSHHPHTPFFPLVVPKFSHADKDTFQFHIWMEALFLFS